MAGPRREVVFPASADMQILGVVGPAEFLDAATQLVGPEGGYVVRIATLNGKPVRCSSGIRVDADMPLGHVKPAGVDIGCVTAPAPACSARIGRRRGVVSGRWSRRFDCC